MRLKANPPTRVLADGALSYNAHSSPNRTPHDLISGSEHVAMGIGFWDGIAWVEIATEGGFLMSIPITEFEVVRGSPSRFWEMKVDADGTVRLWPPSFYQGTYHSDLADLAPEVVRDFERVREQIEQEDAGHVVTISGRSRTPPRV